LLDLGAPGLTLSSKIAEHSFAYRLGLSHHVAAANPAVFDQCFGLARRSLDRLLPGRSCLVTGQFSRCDCLVTDRFGLAFGSFSALTRREVGSFEHLGRFGAERLSHPVCLEMLRRNAIELGQPTGELVAGKAESADLLRRSLQLAADRGGVESAPDKIERGRLETRWVEVICGRIHDPDAMGANRPAEVSPLTLRSVQHRQ